MATVRELIKAFSEAAGDLPEGLDTAVRIGVCDGENLQLVASAEVDYWARISMDRSVPDQQFVLVRGHYHPGGEQ